MAYIGGPFQGIVKLGGGGGGPCSPATATLDGDTLATIPSGSTEAITVQDQNANDITTQTSVASDNVIEVPIYNTASLIKTGQTTSVISGDDGDTERGRLVNWMTLNHNNPFGNTNRWTLLDGSATTNGVDPQAPVLDWSTWVQADETVMAYLFSFYSTQTGTQTIANWLSGQPYTEFTYAGWYVCNIRELQNICNYEYSSLLNGDPFNLTNTASSNVWTCTSRPTITTQFFAKTGNDSRILYQNDTNTYRTILVRTFTLTELGL